MCNVEKWVRDVKNYVRNVDEDMINDRRLIFGIDTKIFFTYTEPPRQITVLVCNFGHITFKSLYST